MHPSQSYLPSTTMGAFGRLSYWHGATGSHNRLNGSMPPPPCCGAQPLGGGAECVPRICLLSLNEPQCLAHLAGQPSTPPEDARVLECAVTAACAWREQCRVPLLPGGCPLERGEHLEARAGTSRPAVPLAHSILCVGARSFYRAGAGQSAALCHLGRAARRCKLHWNKSFLLRLELHPDADSGWNIDSHSVLLP